MPLGVKNAHQVGAVIHGDVRLVIERRQNVVVVSVVVLAFDREHANAVIAHHAGRNIVLRRKRIRSAQHDIRTAIAKANGQICRLRGHVQACRNAYAFQWLVLNEFLADDLQDLHRLIGPFDPLLAEIGKIYALDIALQLRRSG